MQQLDAALAAATIQLIQTVASLFHFWMSVNPGYSRHVHSRNRLRQHHENYGLESQKNQLLQLAAQANSRLIQQLAQATFGYSGNPEDQPKTNYPNQDLELDR